jgi:hypothetical protein
MSYPPIIPQDKLNDSGRNAPDKFYKALKKYTFVR